MTSFNVDVSELVALADDLGAASVTAHAKSAAQVRLLTERGAEDARNRIKGQIRGVYLPHYAASITSESSGLRGEYGPDAGHMQGGMGPGVEFGSVNTSPKPHIMPSAEQVLKEADPRFGRLVAEVLW